jgi:hypothetical protein
MESNNVGHVGGSLIPWVATDHGNINADIEKYDTGIFIGTR